MKALQPFQLRLIPFFVGILFFTNCEDVIDVNVDEAPAQLVVDAWLNNKPEQQTIRLTFSQPYFQNEFTAGAEGANVVLENQDQGSILIFEDQGKGDYTWTPNPGESIGQVGDTFQLGIELNGEAYGGISIMNRVPKIDSITYEFETDELFGPDGIYAEFFARDFVGRGDTYWIKTYKNGLYLNKPSEMNLAFDAGFDGGGDSDGLIFIPPIRNLINRVPDEDNPEDDSMIPPYAEGDSIYVEIHSITNEAFAFLELARDQMNNGSNTIFSIPIANTRGNIINAQTEDFALGMFCVSAVEALGRKID